MGNENAKRAKEQPLLSEPWRKIEWTSNASNLKSLRGYKPQTEGQQIRILLHGPNGAGKSSFINSVGSTLLRRMYIQALVDNVGGYSFTKQYTTYKIQKEKEDPGTFYPFVFNDIMGLDAKHGVKVEDLELALKGHIKDDYLFNPVSKVSEDDACYNKSPDFNDKVHVLVLVINADTVSLLPSDMVKKIKEVREKATALGIPQLAIITKIDQVCPEVQKDLKNIYKIQSAKEKMEKLSVDTGIPMNCIFPVKNYHEEISLDDDTDTLILSALAQIIISGEDHIKFVKNKNPPPDKYA